MPGLPPRCCCPASWTHPSPACQCRLCAIPNPAPRTGRPVRLQARASCRGLLAAGRRPEPHLRPTRRPLRVVLGQRHAWRARREHQGRSHRTGPRVGRRPVEPDRCGRRAQLRRTHRWIPLVLGRKRNGRARRRHARAIQGEPHSRRLRCGLAAGLRAPGPHLCVAQARRSLVLRRQRGSADPRRHERGVHEPHARRCARRVQAGVRRSQPCVQRAQRRHPVVLGS